MKKIKELLSDKQLYIFLLIVLLFFGIFIKPFFSVDTYQLFGSDNMSYMEIYKEDGRLIHYFTLNIFRALDFSFNTIHVIFFLASTVFMTLSIYFLNSVLKKYIKNSLICSLISILIIINPFSIELWLFTEMAMMELSILSCVLAFKFFDMFLEKKDKKNVFYSMVCMFIALFSYQGTVAIFIALSSFLIIKYSNLAKDFVKNNIYLILCYVIPTVINLVVVKIMGTSRVGSEINIFETIMFATGPALGIIFKSFYILPIGIFLAYFIIDLVFSIVSIATNKEKSQKRFKQILGLVYVILITYAFTILPMFAQDASSIAVFPRSTYAFGSIIGIICAYAFINIEYSKKLEKIVVIAAIILLSIQLIRFNNIATNRYMVNAIDKYIACEVKEKVEDYEKTTGKKVKNIAFYNLEKAKKYYPGLDDGFNISARTEKMSSFYLIKYYLNKPLNLTDGNNSIYKEYFENKKWTNFDLDQIIIKDDTIHIFVY